MSRTCQRGPFGPSEGTIDYRLGAGISVQAVVTADSAPMFDVRQRLSPIFSKICCNLPVAVAIWNLRVQFDLGGPRKKARAATRYGQRP